MFALLSLKLPKLIIFLFPLLFLFLMYIIRTEQYYVYEIWGFEDSVFENMQSFFYFLSFLTTIVVSKIWFSRKNKLLLLVFLIASIGVFLIIMEEISWGQRLLNFQTTGFFEAHNVQNEVNFHNLSIVYDEIRFFYILVGLFGTFSFLGKSFISRFNTLQKLGLNYLLVPWFLIFYFTPLLVNIFQTPFLAPQDFEMFEFLLSIGFLLFFVNIYSLVNKDSILSKKFQLYQFTLWENEES